MRERNYERELDELKDQVQALTKELKSTGKRVAHKASDQAEDYIQEARDYYDKLSDTASEKWDELKHEAKDMGGRADRYAKENPWKTAGMAAAAGFLAAMLLGPKRRP